MLFRTALRRGAYDELLVVGSRWRRVNARYAGGKVGPPHAEAGLAVPSITVIPTLHVASIAFYDRVLEYMQQATRRNKNVVILLEGICDSEEAEKAQLQEYRDIASNRALQDAMRQKADDNTLYPPELMQEICNELALRYDAVTAYEKTIRLQECYLKPKMAALCGLNLNNQADLDMKEVQKFLMEESARLEAEGSRLPSSVSVAEIGAFPIIRKQRERRVAGVARLQCQRWVEEEVEGEVIIPWGYFHADAIVHYILDANNNEVTKAGSEANARASSVSSSADTTGSARGESTSEGANKASETAAPTAPAKETKSPNVIFVEADELVAKIPFDVPKEVFTRVDANESDSDAAETKKG